LNISLLVVEAQVVLPIQVLQVVEAAVDKLFLVRAVCLLMRHTPLRLALVVRYRRLAQILEEMEEDPH
jgi:ABC-type arginine/histidine transport system permease subunit